MCLAQLTIIYSLVREPSKNLKKYQRRSSKGIFSQPPSKSQHVDKPPPPWAARPPRERPPVTLDHGAYRYHPCQRDMRPGKSPGIATAVLACFSHAAAVSRSDQLWNLHAMHAGVPPLHTGWSHGGWRHLAGRAIRPLWGDRIASRPRPEEGQRSRRMAPSVPSNPALAATEADCRPR